MKFISALVTAASGSIRGCTASRNRSGAYFRGRVVPVNPGSIQQNAVRNNLAALVAAWTSTLTQAERDAWSLWADNTPQTDPLGQTYHMTGQNAFIGMNAVRNQGGEATLLVAPAVFSGAVLTPPNMTAADQSLQQLTIAFTNTDVWANSALGGLNIYVGRPQNPSVAFYKGPYQYTATIDGKAVPPLSPLQIASVIPFVAGQRVHVQFRAYNADGRISSVQRDSIIAVA